jgi:hypothetical protein
MASSHYDVRLAAGIMSGSPPAGRFYQVTENPDMEVTS